MAKLCDVVGLSSTASVFGTVGRLAEAGNLQRLDGRIPLGTRFLSQRLVGYERTRLPQPVSPQEQMAIMLDDYIIEEPDLTALHRVRDDSMIDAHITDGDLAVECNSPSNPGDVALAVVDREHTVKTPRLDDGGRYFLKAANAADARIHPATSLGIMCVVVGVGMRMRR